MKNVTVIEKSNTEIEASSNRKTRVCAYCRVSSTHKEQENSFGAQVRHYKKYIKSNDQWELAGIYADEGISGTKKEIRPEFMRLINDCENGRIDMVITKSISRFARNTADCIETVRKLKSLGVTVYFEKENINTVSQESELIISVLSSLAQEEAASISSNIRWSNQKRYKQGKFQISPIKIMGYDKDENGDLVINQAEAEIVKRVFREYLGGKGTGSIARSLNEENLPTITGVKWRSSTIGRMVTNEKYCGDVLLQKTITADSVTFKRKHNKGELPQYYIKNNHEPIISREDFERVKELLEIRRKEKGIDEEAIKKMANRYPLTGKVICGNCGRTFIRMTCQSTKQYKYIALICKSKYSEYLESCEMSAVREDRVILAFIDMYNKLYSNWRTLLLPHRTYLKTLVQSTADRTEINNIDNQIIELAEKESMLQMLLAKGHLEPVLFTQKINEIKTKLNELKTRKQTISMDMVNKDISLVETDKSIEFIKNHSLIDEFDEACFNAIVKDIVVKSRNNLCFRLKNGMELDWVIGSGTINNRHMPYGYTLGNNGLPVIDEEKGVYIKKIFEMACEGVNEGGILSWLNQEAVKPSENKTKWTKGPLFGIVSNAKYIGDETFPAIISKETLEKANQIITGKNIRYKKYSLANRAEQRAQYPFSGKVICEVCGGIFKRQTSKSKTSIRHLWRCTSYVKGGKVYCMSIALEEKQLEQKFIEVLNQLKKNFDTYAKDISNSFKPAINEKITELDKEIQITLRVFQKAQSNQSEAMKAEEKIRELLKKRVDEVWSAAAIDDFDYLNEKIQTELMIYEKKNQLEFDGQLFRRVVKQITVTKHNTLLFQFINGIVIEKEPK